MKIDILAMELEHKLPHWLKQGKSKPMPAKLREMLDASHAARRVNGKASRGVDLAKLLVEGKR